MAPVSARQPVMENWGPYLQAHREFLFLIRAWSFHPVLRVLDYLPRGTWGSSSKPTYGEGHFDNAFRLSSNGDGIAMSKHNWARYGLAIQ